MGVVGFPVGATRGIKGREMKTKDIRPGDILLETDNIYGHSGVQEVGRYLVVGRHIEFDEFIRDPEPRSIMYFETVLLRIGLNGSMWSRHNSPGDTYLLSEHEITLASTWKRLHKSSLSWSDEYDSDNQA